MKWLLVFALAGPVISLGSTIDVTGADTVLLHTGDTLTFTLQTYNYGQNARGLGLSVDPSLLRFSLATAPASVAGLFAAMLSSPTSGYEVALAGDLSFISGTLNSSGYTGAISALKGQIAFTSEEAARIFGGNTVKLSFLNLGSELTLGLPGVPLPRDMFGSLSGGPLTVGAMAAEASVTSGRAPISGELMSYPDPVPTFQQARDESGTAVPEPASAALMLGGGALLCGVSMLLNRLSRRLR